MNKLNKIFVLTILLFSTFTTFCQQIDNPEITAEEIRQHVDYFASDDLKGRDSGTEELFEAANYIKDEFVSYGLKPLFDESFLQEFPFIKLIELTENNSINFSVGDEVNEGEVLARLKGKEDLEAAISAAEFEIISAQKALDDLQDAAEDIRNQKQAEVAAAARQVRDAQYKVDNFTPRLGQEEMEPMEAVDIMREKLALAQERFEPYRYESSNNPTRENLKDDLNEAQADLDSAVKRLEYENALSVAETNLRKAREDYEIYQAGPDPKDVAFAESRIANAEAALKAAQATLDDLELRARFDGTAVEKYVRIGEWVNPGQTILLLADLDDLRVETTDLSEIDAARIKVGDKAIVSFDALPDVVVNGTVDRIAPKASSGSGVNYTVVVILDEIPEELRWDMTAFIDVEVD